MAIKKSLKLNNSGHELLIIKILLIAIDNPQPVLTQNVVFTRPTLYPVSYIDW